MKQRRDPEFSSLLSSFLLVVLYGKLVVLASGGSAVVSSDSTLSGPDILIQWHVVYTNTQILQKCGKTCCK